MDNEITLGYLIAMEVDSRAKLDHATFDIKTSDGKAEARISISARRNNTFQMSLLKTYRLYINCSIRIFDKDVYDDIVSEILETHCINNAITIESSAKHVRKILYEISHMVREYISTNNKAYRIKSVSERMPYIGPYFETSLLLKRIGKAYLDRKQCEDEIKSSDDIDLIGRNIIAIKGRTKIIDAITNSIMNTDHNKIKIIIDISKSSASAINFLPVDGAS